MIDVKHIRKGVYDFDVKRICYRYYESDNMHPAILIRMKLQSSKIAMISLIFVYFFSINFETNLTVADLLVI